MTSNIVLSTQEYNVVGKRPIRHDGPDKVTGRARYSADIDLPGLLHGKILRSPHPHAKIKSIDASRALALPGVKAVATSADFSPQTHTPTDIGEAIPFDMKVMADNCLADDKALYKGHAVAAVAATSPHIAEEALSLINVDYEVLPTVVSVQDAMKDDAPVLHDYLSKDGGKGTNIANHFVYEKGDIQKGFKEADVVVEREFHTQSVHQGYIEPHSATALWNPDGNVTIWCSSQGHFAIRSQAAQILGIPISSIKVVPMEIGGGFGGKTNVYLEPVAAVLSRKTGQPVKLSMSRIEVFEGSGPTSGSYMRVKIGAKKDGRITAADAYLAYEAGAFPGSPVVPGAMCMLAPYDLENARAEGYDVVCNKPKTAAYRAPGAPGAAFAAETVIDEICEKVGMDPVELRLLNGVKEGSQQITGVRFGRIGYTETLQAAKDHEHYKAPLEGPNRGRGIATGFWFNGTGPACATASVNPDGTISLVEGSPDIGGTRAVAAMHTAEVLGISAEDVHPVIGDTDSVGFTSMTGGSGVAFKTGWACYEAAQDIKRQLIQRAATIWDVSPDDVEYADAVLAHKSDPELRLTLKDLAGMLNATGGPVVGRANVDPRGAGNAFAAHIVDVEVDPETGKVDILRYTAVQDAGKAIHPSYVEGQIQGGVVQGIGWALNEEYFFNDKGEMTNSSFLDYRMPTSLDLPMIDTVIVEVANPAHPYGVRGTGEMSIVPPMAAIANAIYDATGVRMTVLPMSPGAILEATWQQKVEGKK